MWDRGIWLNEPGRWSADGSRLSLTTGDQTDFWRETHYGFTHDNGHFLGIEARSAFRASLRVQGRFETLYDQAGMMVRIDDAHWVKFGVERGKGRTMFSSVLTLGRSDYQRQYEPILYGWKQGVDRFWCGARDQGDVWFAKKPRVKRN